jgi:hypothetical protein
VFPLTLSLMAAACCAAVPHSFWLHGQGLPVGHTTPCYPVHSPGIRQHRGPTLRDSEADTQARARFALLGNAVTVQVRAIRPSCACSSLLTLT